MFTSQVPAVLFSAYSGTGKTTLIERLIPALVKRGIKVGVVKHDAHRFQIDKPGKDSYRFSQAGALITAIGSDELTAFVERRALTPLEIINRMEGVDLVLIEGYSGFDCPAIGIERMKTGQGLRGNPSDYAAIVSDGPAYPGLPMFSFEDIEPLVDFILELCAQQQSPRHLIIRGARGAGKSTLIHRLLELHLHEPLYGFLTQKEEPNEQGLCPVYIHPANTASRVFTDSNLIGLCSQSSARAIPESFEGYGLSLLEKIPDGALIVMDELGFMESAAPKFCARVLELLNSRCRVIAAVKDRRSPFLEAVGQHPQAKIVNINPENRELLYQSLASFVL